MAFRQPTAAPRHIYISPAEQQESTSTALPNVHSHVEDSQEWVLFSPLQDTSTATDTQTDQTPRTAGLSHISDFGSLATRSNQQLQSHLGDALTEDGELDSLDEGLHAFREPSVYRSFSNQGHGPILPAHDGLGTFPASSQPVQEQLWQHEQYNPKRKYDGSHRRRSSVQRRLDTIEELESQISEEKRLRIECWRMEQSQALLDDIEKETRRRERHRPSANECADRSGLGVDADLLGTTPKQSDIVGPPALETDEAEPFWKRITRKFIRDVIGIDEPLLSVIVGETLPEDISAIAELVSESTDTRTPQGETFVNETWPDRLLHRIARELGLLVNKLSPHPGAFSSVTSPVAPDYAGIPVSEPPSAKLSCRPGSAQGSSSKLAPSFSPTAHDLSHDASWGLEEGIPRDRAVTEAADEADRLRREREYWERELDIKMVFRFLKSRFSSRSGPHRTDTPLQPLPSREDSNRRADVIRRHHPLVARAHQPSISRLRRDSALRSFRRPGSSCASESVRSSRRPSLARSGASSRNYWDIGGSIGSGSGIASAGIMGAWGEV
jgi:hypothetical protein